MDCIASKYYVTFVLALIDKHKKEVKLWQVRHNRSKAGWM